MLLFPLTTCHGVLQQTINSADEWEESDWSKVREMQRDALKKAILWKIPIKTQIDKKRNA